MIHDLKKILLSYDLLNSALFFQVTIFGPEGPCYVEAIVSQSRNIPMISYVCI